MEDIPYTQNIKQFVVNGAPTSAFYMRNFVSNDEEEMLLSQIHNAPKPKWTQLSNRRLQNWGGLPHPKGMIAETIPSWLDTYLTKLNEMNLFEGNKPNHVLINEYLPGQGIMPHVDGPLFHPIIATINLGSHTMLDFYKQIDHSTKNCPKVVEGIDTDFSSRYIGSFFLEAKSLVCFKEDMYTEYLHGIREVTEDALNEHSVILNKEFLNLDGTYHLLERSTRTSVTIRYFPKVLKIKLKFGNKV